MTFYTGELQRIDQQILKSEKELERTVDDSFQEGMSDMLTQQEKSASSPEETQSIREIKEKFAKKSISQEVKKSAQAGGEDQFKL